MTPGSSHDCMVRLVRWLAARCHTCPWGTMSGMCVRCPSLDATHILRFMREEAALRADGSSVPETEIGFIREIAKLFKLKATRRSVAKACATTAKNRMSRNRYFRNLVKHGYLTVSDDGKTVGLSPLGLALIHADANQREQGNEPQ
mgnify:CR=1 FL=1